MYVFITNRDGSLIKEVEAIHHHKKYFHVLPTESIVRLLRNFLTVSIKASK